MPVHPMNSAVTRLTDVKVSSFCTYGNCVEVGVAADGSIVVRDNKDVDRSVSLNFTQAEWAAFVQGVKAGEFDYC